MPVAVANTVSTEARRAVLPTARQVLPPTASFRSHLPLEYSAFQVPGEGATMEELRAWETAKAYEQMLLASAMEDVYIAGQERLDEAFGVQAGTVFAPEMAKAMAGAMVESGTEVASNSIARQVYEEIRAVQQETGILPAVRMEV